MSARVAPLVAIAAATACGQPDVTECTCADPRVVVEVPPARAGVASRVNLSGPACAAVAAACTRPAGDGCAQYAFRADGEGQCVVEVQFASGPADFAATLSFVRLPCCSGFYVEPPAAGVVEVPDLDASTGEPG